MLNLVRPTAYEGELHLEIGREVDIWKEYPGEKLKPLSLTGAELEWIYSMYKASVVKPFNGSEVG